MCFAKLFQSYSLETLLRVPPCARYLAFIALILLALAGVSVPSRAKGDDIKAVSLTGPIPLPVSGTVGVTGAVNAQQLGSWNVSLVGAPTVNLNSATRPIPIRDVDNPARHSFILNAPFGEESFSWKVPAGSIYVVEHYGLVCDVGATGALTSVGLVIAGPSGFSADYAIPRYADANGFLNGHAVNQWQASASTRLYANPGNAIGLTFSTNYNATGAAAERCSQASVSGYSLSVP